MEMFKPIKNYEGLYEISNYGNVKSLAKKCGKGKGYLTNEKLLNLHLDRQDYKYVALSRNGKVKKHKIHRLVAENFICNPCKKKQVNHINGIKYDNFVLNLEWVTASENSKHAYKIGLQKPIKGKNNNRSIKVNQYDINMNYINSYNGLREAMRETGCAVGDVAACCKGRKKHVKNFIWRYA